MDHIDVSALHSGKRLTTRPILEEKLTIMDLAVEGVKLPWVQGGCTDGKHLYEFMISPDSLHCMIVKYDLATQEVIGYSSDLNLGHANDGAYNPHNNTLAIVHCCDLLAPTSNLVYIVDADTLQLLKTIELPRMDILEITYDPNGCRYITTSETEMVYWSEDFTLLDVKPVQTTHGWPTQGIECDGKYVYRLEFYLEKDENENILDMRNNIHIHDIATGQELALVPVNNFRESENLFIWNGKFYMSCNSLNWQGCEVYCFTIEPDDVLHECI